MRLATPFAARIPLLAGLFMWMLPTNVPSVSADEGMYLFNDLPKELLKERYDFEIDQAWADHLRLSSVRFNSGGSGSFVSSDGLVLTNHHVAADTLHKLSTKERNLIKDGYLARSHAEELRTGFGTEPVGRNRGRDRARQCGC